MVGLGDVRGWCITMHNCITIHRSNNLSSQSVERYVRTYRNMRLRDRIKARGVKAEKQLSSEPKAYPLEKGDWSSCDASDNNDEAGMVAATMGF